MNILQLMFTWGWQAADWGDWGWLGHNVLQLLPKMQNQIPNSDENAALACIRGYCRLPGVGSAGPRDPRALRTWGSPVDGNNGDTNLGYSLSLPGQETPGPTAACRPWQKCFQECRNDSASSDVWSNKIEGLLITMLNGLVMQICRALVHSMFQCKCYLWFRKW